MIDLTRDFDSTDETIREILDKVDFQTQKLVLLLNKTDICEVNKNVTTINNIVSRIENKGLKAALSNYTQNDAQTVPILPISAKTRTGIEELRSILASSQRDLLADSDTTLVTNQRHLQALTDTRTSLLRLRQGLASGLPTDLAAQDIREAIYHLGSIVGEISTDEVLGNIFRNFCIGK
jgi:tRNA modification GTPase